MIKEFIKCPKCPECGNKHLTYSMKYKDNICTTCGWNTNTWRFKHEIN